MRIFRLTMALPHTTRSNTVTLYQPEKSYRDPIKRAAEAVAAFARKWGVSPDAVDWEVTQIGRI